jgi:hypothetical protein
MKSRRTWIWIAASLATIFVGCNGLARMDYFCSLCATDRIALQLRTDLSPELIRAHCFDSDPRAVSFDSEPAFRAWFDDFKKKAAMP